MDPSTADRKRLGPPVGMTVFAHDPVGVAILEMKMAMATGGKFTQTFDGAGTSNPGVGAGRGSAA